MSGKKQAGHRANRQAFALSVDGSDIKERFIRSGGPGGQHVNKVSTGVYLKHIPTGVEAKCTVYRSQSQNRSAARKILCEKVASLIAGIERQARQKIEKIRRQHRRRSRKAKELVLAQKKILSREKELRKKIERSGTNGY